MKIIISAVALAIATSVVAQTPPAQPQHQDHPQHQSHGAAQTPQADHSVHHDQHKGHAMEGGCCADKDGNGKMDCCEKMSAGKGGGGCCGKDPAAKPKASEQPAQPQAHQNH